jgi:hypothetical protein
VTIAESAPSRKERLMQKNRPIIASLTILGLLLVGGCSGGPHSFWGAFEVAALEANPPESLDQPTIYAWASVGPDFAADYLDSLTDSVPTEPALLFLEESNTRGWHVTSAFAGVHRGDHSGRSRRPGGHREEHQERPREPLARH